MAKGILAGGGRYDDVVTWKDIHWLKSITSLPIIIKGILTAEDAVLAVEHGAAGIVVSNHGGRQLDTSPATVCLNGKIIFIYSS